MAKTYRVTGACVTHIPAGQQLITLYSGNLLPPGVPQDRIDHLLSVRMIEEVESAPAETASPDTAAQEPKAPEPAAKVNARSSKPDLVDYGVARGDDRAELEALTREQLLGKYVRS
ncbi:hypothetical protein [Sphaerisporangium sp. NPDC051011]|uniref:hypothetical protein n=1 Tax=Sphaerisporangium sp. NPDC051011 TaxID=3155792 RepID=UPI0033F0CCB9